MRLIKTEDAVGHVLCHDMTQIIKDQYKDARFRKGHVVTEEDIPVLLSMGKEHLYVWEMTPGMVHENDAAERLLALCGQENMIRSGVKEGKIELKAACDGVFLVDSARLVAVNSQDEVMIATRKGGMAVREGDKLAGMRVIPLIIEEEKLQKAEQAAGDKPLLSLKPYVRKTACIVATGGEVKKGLIQGYVHAGRHRQAQDLRHRNARGRLLRRRGGERARRGARDAREEARHDPLYRRHERRPRRQHAGRHQGRGREYHRLRRAGPAGGNVPARLF